MKLSREKKKEEILDNSKELKDKCPYYRWGQAVFNYVDEFEGVARAVQFEDRVDCFYCDEDVDAFVEKVLDRLGY